MLDTTDMGRHPVEGLLPGQVARTADAVRALLGPTLCAGHLDLTAELLTCWQALGLTEAPLAELAVRCLLTAAQPCGAVPGPAFHQQVAASLTGDRLEEYRFRTCYHTTPVAMITVDLWAGEGRA